MSEALDIYIPLSLALNSWPEELIPKPNFDGVYLKNPNVVMNTGQTFQYTGSLVFAIKLEIDVPLIDGASIAFAKDELGTGIAFSIMYSQGLFQLNLTELSVSLLIQSELIQTVELIGDSWEVVMGSNGEPEPVAIEFSGVDLGIDSKGDFSFEFALGAPTFSVSTFTIGNTGVIIDIGDFSVITSEKDALSSELLPDDFDSTRRGVWIEEATVYLPDGITGILPSSITLSDAFIGSGGFCGSITGDWENSFNEISGEFEGDGVGGLFGIDFAIKSLGIEFQQNTLMEGSISGEIMIPFFDAPLQVDITLTNDGDFAVALSSDESLAKLEKEGVISVELDSIEFYKEDDEFFIKITGAVTPLFAGDFEWPTFELKGLTISSKGDVQIDGGWIELPEQKSFDFNGFNVGITQLGFGKEEIDGVDYSWIGFSGGIQIVSGVPLEGGVEGLKILWSNDGDFKLQLSGISIAFEIAEVLNFSGSVLFFESEDGSNKGFAGGVAITLVPLNGLGMEGQFLAGRNSDEGFNYFYIYLDVALPVGIPIVPPALGLYGLSGLFGYNVTVDKAADEDWYADYYKRSAEGITDARKWKGEKDAMAFGAGVTLRTLPDTGFSLSAKVLLVVLIPGPIILIEGKAAIIKKDISNADDFPFKMLAVIDGESGTFLLNIEAGYKFPAGSGDLVNVSGVAEAFFNFNKASDWHVYIGQDTPDSKRVQAEILSFFKATSYFMVDSSGLRMGVWIGYNFEEKYGPLKVVLSAWIEGKLSLSFHPIQAEGSVVIFGEASIKAFGIGLGLSIEASVSAAAPKPLKLEGKVEVKLKTPFGNPKATVKLKWEKDNGDWGYPLLVSQAGGSHAKVTENSTMTINNDYSVDDDGFWKSGSGSEPSVGNWDNVDLIPPDGQIVIDFAKAMKDNTGKDIVTHGDPGKETVGKYYYKYALESLTLEESSTGDSGDWTDVSERLFGVWQDVEGHDGFANTTLVIGAKTPFEFANTLESMQTYMMSLFAQYPEYPCINETEEIWQCVDFEKYALGQRFYPFLENEGVLFYSKTGLLISTCKGENDQTHSLRTAHQKPKKICIDIPGVGKRIIPNYTIVDYVRITAGSLEPLDFTGSSLYIRTSSWQGSNKPVTIDFPNKYFPDFPEKVYITYSFPDNSSATLRSFDESGQQLSEQVISYSPLGRNTLIIDGTIHGKTISRIEIQGSILYIYDICYELAVVNNKEKIVITYPESMAKAKIQFCPKSTGKIVTYSDDETKIETVLIADYLDNIVEISSDETAIRIVEIVGEFSLLEVCGMTVDDYETWNYNNIVTSRNETTLEEIWDKTTCDILNPSSYYKLKINTKASTQKISSGSDWSEKEFTEYLFFRTGSPHGTSGEIEVVSNETDEQQVYPASGPLKDLSEFISETIPLNTNADKPQIPAYRTYDVGVKYNEDYVEQMYISDDFYLKIQLYDNNNNPVLDEAGAPLYIYNQWATNTELVRSNSESLYETILDASDCFGYSMVTETSDPEIILDQVNRLALKPSIQYSGKLVAAGDNDHTVYSFAFKTSVFCSFAHHLNSFIDGAWDNFALLKDETYTIDPSSITTIVNDTTISEAIQHTQLLGLFGIPISRTLPQQMEISVLNDAVTNYGILLESPEPLNWDRITLSASRVASTSFEVALSEKAVKINDAVLEVSSDANDQSIELMVLSSIDLSGYTITYKESEAAEEDVFSLYFTFPEGSVYSEGTLIRIYAGIDPESGEITENHILYAGLVDVPFNNVSRTVNITSVSDELMHSRELFLESEYVVLTTHLIKNDEGTRAFIFFEDTEVYNDLLEGIYRLSFTYERKKTGLTTLRRYGFTEEEIVHLGFSLPAILPD